MLAYTGNPSTQEGEAEGWRVQDQPGIHSKILSQTEQKEQTLGIYKEWK